MNQENHLKGIFKYVTDDQLLRETGNLYAENQELKQKLDFLTKRENKLQQIEQMFKSGMIDLDELRKIVLLFHILFFQYYYIALYLE